VPWPLSAELGVHPVTVEKHPRCGSHGCGPAQVAKYQARFTPLLINTMLRATVHILKDLPYDPFDGLIPVIPHHEAALRARRGKAAGGTTVAELIAGRRRSRVSSNLAHRE